MSLRGMLFQTHWLVGITAGIVLAIVGATGALLSFETEIVTFIDRDVRRVPPSEAAAPTAPELLARIGAAHPGKRITALSISGDPQAAPRVTFASSAPPSGEGGGRGEQHYVDPHTGASLTTGPSRAETFFRDVRGLHRWLMLGEWGSRDIGRQIVGASTILLIFMSLTGLYLRWPRGRAARSLRTWLVPNFELRGRAFLWNLHSVAGTWVLPAYLILALTGLQWSYEWYRDGLYAVAGVERPARAGQGGDARGSRATVELSPAWDTFVRTTGGSFSAVNVNLGAPTGKPIEFRYLEQDPRHDRAYNTLAIDAAGTVVKHERYSDKKLNAQLVSSIFPLHSGSYFGVVGVILFLLASLAMPLFAVTGWMMYLKRRAPRAQRAPLTTAADEA
jgi:sulfite reductase (NADPH) flavoprotein alpha-component